MPDFVARFFQLSSFRKDTIQYFADLTLKLIEQRKKDPDLQYNDFIELLLKSEAEQVEKQVDEKGHIVRKLTTEEIVGEWH